MSLNHLYLCFDLIDDHLDHSEILTAQPHYTQHPGRYSSLKRRVMKMMNGVSLLFQII